MNAKDRHTLELIKSAIHKKDPTAEVILFGSRARGTEHEESDWDILVLVDKPKVDWETENVYRDELFEVQLETGEPISTFVYSKKEWHNEHPIMPLYENVKKEGILLQWINR